MGRLLCFAPDGNRTYLLVVVQIIAAFHVFLYVRHGCLDGGIALFTKSEQSIHLGILF